MLKNFLMAAGLAAAFSLSAQVAEAKVNVTIGIGEPGGYCYYNYDPYPLRRLWLLSTPGLFCPPSDHQGPRILQGSGLGVAGPRLSQHYYDRLRRPFLYVHSQEARWKVQDQV